MSDQSNRAVPPRPPVPTRPTLRVPTLIAPGPRPVPNRPVTASTTTTPSKDEFEAEVERLNERFRQALRKFSSIPGRSETWIPLDQRRQVGFIKDANEWTFRLDPDLEDTKEPVKDWHACSIAERAAIAAGLGRLYQAVIKGALVRTKNLNDAHKALDEFEASMNEEESA